MFLFRSKWNTNKNFRGSCTYYKLKEPTDDDVFIKDLAEPIGELKPVSKLSLNSACVKKSFYNPFIFSENFFRGKGDPSTLVWNCTRCNLFWIP